MPYKKKLHQIALDNSNELFNKVKTETLTQIKDNEFEFYELEPFFVQDVLLDEKELPKKRGAPDWKYYGAIKGYWVTDRFKKTFPKGEEWVLPLDPHIKRYPITGEIVVCVNYSWHNHHQTYYTTIVNYRNNPNNSKVSWGNPKLSPVSTAPTFHKPVVANPGDIVIQGRFNNSINIGSQDMVGSSIKLVAHGRENPTYDLEKDAASIYIQDGGNVTVTNPNKKMGSRTVTGKKIILDADEIVINAKSVLRLFGADLVEIVGGNTEIKHNADGKIITGETEKAVDELRERVKKKAVDEFNEKKKEFLGAYVKSAEAFNKGIADLKKLDDKMKNAIKDVEKKIEIFRKTSFTLNATKFTETQDKVNRIQQQMSAQVPVLPNGAPNPEFIRLTKDLLDVFRSFVTLDFINEDIVTIEKKK